MDECPWILEVSDATFEREVLERSRQLPVLVDFWAPWCQPCATLGPVLEDLAEEAAGRFLLACVNVDQCPQASASYGVRSIPLVLAMHEGEVLAQVVGVQPEGVYRQLVERLESVREAES